jgi:hypothetical protein
MITSVDFKKHISKTLSSYLKDLGFKGSGFNYLMDTDNFVFAIGIQASQHGGQCCAEFGIQPKSIDTSGFEKLDFKKLKYFNCEFRTRLAPTGQSDKWWKYSENEQGNLQIVNEIIELIKNRALPIIQLFEDNPNILETIELADLDNLYVNVPKKLLGMNLATTDIRFAWAMTKALAKTNPTKAKMFAEYGLSKLDSSSTFMGKQDFERILTENNGA